MRFKTFASLVLAAALGTSACAAPPTRDVSITRLPGCSPIAAENVHRQQIEADVAAFIAAVPAAAAVRFEVQDCAMDGQIYNGKVIVLSARLARLVQAQRFFIIAHEFGHHQLEHQAQMSGLIARNGGRHEHNAYTELAHRNEFEADAYAVRLMHAHGMDPEDAALLFDSLGSGLDNATHPAFARRAQAIRAVRAAVVADDAPTGHTASAR